MLENEKYPEGKKRVKERAKKWMNTLRGLHGHPVVYHLIKIIPAAVRNGQAGQLAVTYQTHQL